MVSCFTLQFSTGSVADFDPITGASVINEGVFYPDFTVERYYPEDSKGNTKGDVIRVVIEVASMSRLDHLKDGTSFRNRVRTQLVKYLNGVGNRGDGEVLGVALLGNTIAILIRRLDGTIQSFPPEGEDWLGLDDPRLVEHLNAARDRPGMFPSSVVAWTPYQSS